MQWKWTRPESLLMRYVRRLAFTNLNSGSHSWRLLVARVLYTCYILVAHWQDRIPQPTWVKQNFATGEISRRITQCRRLVLRSGPICQNQKKSARSWQSFWTHHISARGWHQTVVDGQNYGHHAKKIPEIMSARWHNRRVQGAGLEYRQLWGKGMLAGWASRGWWRRNNKKSFPCPHSQTQAAKETKSEESDSS